MKIALVLGGPSIKSVDFSKVDAHLFISANWSFLIPQVDINVVVDYRCMEKMLADIRFQKWLEHGGICYFVDHCRQTKTYQGIKVVPSTYPKWPLENHHPEDGLYCRSHAGLSALHLATLWVDDVNDEIDIYGLDLNETESGKTENWHSEHDPKWAGHSKTSYPGMIRATDEARLKIPANIRIFNMNPGSAYKGFKFKCHS